MVSPNEYYHWIPSNIWIGLGRMDRHDARFKLKPVYDKWGDKYIQAKATNFYPEGNKEHTSPFVQVEYVTGEQKGIVENVEYDYLINATGPRLKFEATEGLMQDGKSVSVCSYTHAEEAWSKLQASIKKMAQGEEQTFLIGTGQGSATCQGAAFEYILNVEFETAKRGLRDKAKIIWISNEYEMGDFGMGGAFIKRGGYITSTKIFAESFLVQRNIDWITKARVYKVDGKKAYYETLDGEYLEQAYDFAMLIPAFSGHEFQAFDKNENDITPKVFAGNGFMKVDADYSGVPYANWSIKDWPTTYQNQDFSNMFATGIAFAPPHAISKPMKRLWVQWVQHVLFLQVMI
ncbi:MAG: sulfide:quinone oxidoreductase [Planctomycetota bacterium]|jgi:sulfide:quinone oxidoreductase